MTCNVRDMGKGGIYTGTSSPNWIELNGLIIEPFYKPPISWLPHNLMVDHPFLVTLHIIAILWYPANSGHIHLSGSHVEQWDSLKNNHRPSHSGHFVALLGTTSSRNYNLLSPSDRVSLKFPVALKFATFE